MAKNSIKILFANCIIWLIIQTFGKILSKENYVCKLPLKFAKINIGSEILFFFGWAKNVVKWNRIFVQFYGKFETQCRVGVFIKIDKQFHNFSKFPPPLRSQVKIFLIYLRKWSLTFLILPTHWTDFADLRTRTHVSSSKATLKVWSKCLYSSTFFIMWAWML